MIGKQQKKKNKISGITLIALVVTIVVLLILAGVSISLVLGPNGLITKAQEASLKTEQATKNELTDMASIDSLIEEYTGNIEIPQVTDENPGELEQENENTLVINSIEDLVFFAHDVTSGTNYEGKTVKLGLNLDFNSDKSYVNASRTDYEEYGYEGPLKQALITGTGFKPIGGYEEGNNFYGTFDGNNKIIRSLYINIDSTEDVQAGLFCVSYGEIKNIGLENVNINVKGNLVNIGGIVSKTHNNIYNSHVSGTINATGSSWMPVGGLCGVMKEGKIIENCYNLANITCKNIKEEGGGADIGCGGIVGQGTLNINKCYNKGNINADAGNQVMSVGGICGHTEIDSDYIKNCYNMAEVKAYSNVNTECYVGGIIGMSQSSEITNCYNAKTVEGNAVGIMLGGIVGRQTMKDLLVKNVFNIGTLKSELLKRAGGIIGVNATNNKTNFENVYNTGNIVVTDLDKKIGSIAGDIYYGSTAKNCAYLAGTFEKAVGLGDSTGIEELDSVSAFPSILDVVNGDNAFKADANNKNEGYPILEWE